MKIVVIDYDIGNVKSIINAFKFNNWIGMVASLGFIVETFLV